jgi:uncharacterized protein
LTLEMLGPDRILFSTDYPCRFTPEGGAREFLVSADLSDDDREAIAHPNKERLMGEIRRD